MHKTQISSTSTYTRMKLKNSGIPPKNLDKNDDFVYCSSAETQVCHRSYIIAATIQPVIFFSTTYIFYSIYFIIQYNIELIFANTSIIEYWFFFQMLNIFFTELHRLFSFIALFMKRFHQTRACTRGCSKQWRLHYISQ
jgi:hypothetical protein